VGDNTQPEDKLKTSLSRLVPEDSLANQCTRPAAQDRQDVQSLLGNPTTGALCLPFVYAVGDKCDGTHDEHGRNEWCHAVSLARWNGSWGTDQSTARANRLSVR